MTAVASHVAETPWRVALRGVVVRQQLRSLVCLEEQKETPHTRIKRVASLREGNVCSASSPRNRQTSVSPLPFPLHLSHSIPLMRCSLLHSGSTYISHLCPPRSRSPTLVLPFLSQFLFLSPCLSAEGTDRKIDQPIDRSTDRSTDQSTD